MKNRIYTTISIVGLIGIMCFVIYLVGNFIYFGVYEINDISNNNTNIDNVCIDISDNQYNNSSRPVKGMKYKDSLDSLAFSKSVDLSNIDGNQFYSREINEGLTSGRVYK
jgi:hypothetical protein